MTQSRVSQTKKNDVSKSSDFDQLQARRRLASRIQDEYRQQCGDPKERKVEQLIKESQNRQDLLRLLYKSHDSMSLTARPYSVDAKTTAALHLQKASQLLKAIGEDTLATQVDSFGKELAGQP